MFKINSDTAKNRLYITLENLTTEEIKPILDELNVSIAKLTSGFSCLVDIRAMAIHPSEKGIEYIEIIQGALRDSGMGKVVRVIDHDNSEFHKKMELSSKSIGYSAMTATSIEAADKMLDS